MRPLSSATVPVGLFSDQQFSATRLTLAPGESLVIYTDGVSEAENPDGYQYGEASLASLLQGCFTRKSPELVSACIEDLLAFRAGSTQIDDEALTRRAGRARLRGMDGQVLQAVTPGRVGTPRGKHPRVGVPSTRNDPDRGSEDT